jgi:hypothetical protein
VTTAAPSHARTPQARTALAYAAAVFAACSLPGDRLPASGLLSYDKLWHLLAFAVLSALWRWAGRRPRPVFAGGLAFGVLIEAWQHVAPIGRFFDPLDALADAVGLALGLAAVALTTRRPPR